MNPTRCVALILAISVFAVSANAAEDETPQKLPETGKSFADLAAFDQLMRAFVKQNEIPGASLAVVKDGRLVYARGFGYADVDKKEPVQPFSLFRIASISKPITSAAIFRLIDEGKLSLDDRVFDILKYKPLLLNGAKFDKRHSLITIRQLLQHTGGWDRGASFDPMFRPITIARALNAKPPAKPDHIIRYMLGRKLDFDPGQKYAYSNFGYCLLGRVIEKKTGKKYDDYVKREILKPLNITQMRIGRSLLPGRSKNEVRYYRADGKQGTSVFAANLGKPVPRPYGGWHLEAMDSHGAWIASAIDLMRFATAIDRPKKSKILRPNSLKEMFAPPPKPVWRTDAGKLQAAYYACGWMVRPHGDQGRANTWHTGSLDGTSTIIVRRHDGLSWAVLFNTRKTKSGNVPSRVIDPLVHRAANAVERWPEHDLFEQFK